MCHLRQELLYRLSSKLPIRGLIDGSDVDHTNICGECLLSPADIPPGKVLLDRSVHMKQNKGILDLGSHFSEVI
jgi:hypothetical protein